MYSEVIRGKLWDFENCQIAMARRAVQSIFQISKPVGGCWCSVRVTIDEEGKSSNSNRIFTGEQMNWVSLAKYQPTEVSLCHKLQIMLIRVKQELHPTIQYIDLFWLCGYVTHANQYPSLKGHLKSLRGSCQDLLSMDEHRLVQCDSFFWIQWMAYSYTYWLT